MKIMYIIDSLKVGGAEMLLLAMVRAYAEAHEVSVVYFTHGPLYEDVEALGVKVHRISTMGIKDPRVLPRLVSLMNQEKPDVVHTHLSKSDFGGIMAATLANVPARVSSIHNVDPWREKWYLNAFMRQWMASCHMMIAVTEDVRKYVIETTRYPEDKLVTIANGIDTKRFDPNTVQALDKTEWGIEADSLTVGMIGRLEEQKGHHILLKTAAIVTKTVPNARFVIVGDGPLRANLEKQRDDLGLQGKVVFTGILRDIPGVLATLDVVTFSSLWEGLPVALLEAMSMAKPMVSTAVGGIPDVIVEGENGMLVPKENPQALADKLTQVLQDKALADKLGTAARQTIEERYSSDSMHQQILELYQSILEKSKQPA